MEDEEVLIGNQPFIEEHGTTVPEEAEDRIAALQDEGRPRSSSPHPVGLPASSP